jgi:hypothetical protein
MFNLSFILYTAITAIFVVGQRTIYIVMSSGLGISAAPEHIYGFDCTKPNQTK